MQLTNMTSQLYAEDLAVTSCKVADVYEEGILNNIFIKDADASIRNSLHQYWPQNPQADLSDIAFQAESLLSI